MKQRLTLVALAVSVLLIGSGVAFWLIKDHGSQTPKTSSPTTAKTNSSNNVAPSKLSASYLVSGDVFWGRGIDYYAQRTPLKYDWPFSRLKEFHPEKYSGWISDMECPITNKTVPYQTQVDKLILQCPPQYLTAASKYFTAFTLANNHTDNTGADGFADTQKNLETAGIQFFGHYDLSQTQDLCEIVSLPAKVDGRAAKLPIAMCGYHWLSRDPTADELAQITSYAKYFPVWVFAHGGTEYATHSNPQQQALYRQMIDLGADVVFGDHPHVVQNTEAYKGRLIVYDFGNLVYDQWFDAEVTKSLIVNLQLSTEVDKNLQAYLKIAAGCVKFKDDCLARAQAANLQAYKLNYSYKIIAGDASDGNYFDRLKHPGSAATQAWLEKRADWKTTLTGLK